MDINLASMDQQ